MDSRTLINVDLSQAELRVMAVLSEDEWLIGALQENAGDFFDTHMMPVAFPGTIAKYGSVESYKSIEPIQHKEDRTTCKAVVYGLAFGRQAPAIAQATGLTTRGAQVVIDNFLNAAHGLRDFREQIMEAARVPSKRDILINPFGRKYQSEVVTTKNYRNIQREALSFLPQSTSSDILLATGIRINPQLEEWGFRVFNVVHDAMMIEGPARDANIVGRYVGAELRKTGEMVLGPSVPFLSDYSTGNSWADLS